MTTKKKPRPHKLGLNNVERALYCKLVPIAKKLVIENPPNKDGYGAKNKLQIVWTKEFPRPKGFPFGRLVSDIDGKRITEHNACSVLEWLFNNRLTQDSPKKIYATRSAALISLKKIEQNLFNYDEKLLDDLMKMPQNRVSSEAQDTINQGETK